MSTNNIQLKLKKLTLANLILGYIAFSIAAVIFIFFIAALIVKPVGVILVILFGVYAAGLIAAIIIANIILSGFQVHFSKQLKPIGGISKNAVLATMTVCDFLTLAGMIVCIALAILSNHKTVNKSLMNQLNATFSCIALAACLAQAIFNTIYYKKLKKSH